jgi:type I restriction enzyme S subunit
MAGSREVQLAEVVDLVTGFPFKSEGYVDDAVSPRLVRGDNVVQGSIRWENAKRWPSAATEGLERYELARGDVVLAMDRPWIEAGLKYAAISEQDLPAYLVQRVSRLRGINGLDTAYLRYVIGSRDFTHHVISIQTGTAVPHISASQILDFEFTLPPLDEQRRIAHILGTLDDKIELNRRMNETLEDMARALFKSWFVDFDPVRAKAEGRDPGLPKHLADLFPDRLVDSELGEIPEGWRVEPLERQLDVLETGGRPKGGVSMYQTGVPSIGAESIVRLGIHDFSKTKYVPREFFDEMKRGHLADRDVLLYKDGGRPGLFEPHVTLVGDGFPFEECAINEHVYRIRVDPALGQNFLFFWLSSEAAMEEMRVKGTGVAIPGLNSTQVKSLTTLVPASPVVRAFDDLVVPAIGRILAGCNEVVVLTESRDALLSNLLTSDSRVNANGGPT